MAITLTEAAVKRVQEYIKSESLPEGETRLRVGVKGGGCSGFSYLLDLTADAPGEFDEEVEAEGGVKVLIDQKSMLYLEGTVIDYVSDGPLREGFVFKNPNATSSCGCGSSFSA
jgi:iron-sulfur cluster assembly protein